MKIRLLAFLTILVLIAGIFPVAAQTDADTQKLNCLDLSKDDCTIVTTSLANLEKIESVSPTFSMTMAITGAEAVAPGMGLDTSMDVSGSGALVIDHAAMAAAKDAPYKGVSMSFDMNVTSDSQPTDVSFVLVDGVVYFKDDSGAWKGLSIEDISKHPEVMQALMSKMPESSSSSMLGGMLSPDMLSGMMGGMMSGMDNAAGTTAFGVPVDMGGINPMTMLELPGFLKQERGADEDMMGQTMQVFTYTGDIAVALNSTELQTAMSEAMSGAMGGGAASGQGAGAASQMGAMIPVLMQSTTGTVTLTRWIGADDQFIHQVTLVVDAQVDLFGGTATSSKVTPIPPISLKVSMTLGMDKINDTAAPTAPEGATMISPEDLMVPEATPAQ